jgi:uncharacterized protein (TIGR02231 family)
MKRHFVPLTAVILLLPLAPLNAAELTADAPITDVIVYPDRAEITRSVDLEVPRGTSTVIIPRLPTNIVPQSIRVFGDADGRVHITTIATELVRPEPVAFEPDPRIEADIQALLKQKPAIEDRIAIAQMQVDYYKLLLAEAPQVSEKELIKSLDPQQWDSVWSKIGAKLAQAQETVRAARAELQSIDDEVIQHRERQRSNQPQPTEPPALAAHIGVDVDEATTARLRVSYQIAGVSWQPFYHARLNSEKGEVELVQYGEVRQRTGEDWRGVSLVLSTARPALGAELPSLTVWQLQSFDHAKREMANALSEFAARSQSADALEIAPAIVQIAATDFAAEYRVAGKIDLASGDDPQRVVIADNVLESRLAARVVPKVALQAHLYATATYRGRDPLLPGALTVFRDGALLGTGTLPLLRPQEEFHLGFGIDDKIRVEHREVPIDPTTAGLFRDKRRIERQYVTKIANYHEQAIEITLLDQMPVSSNESVTIDLLPDTTTPTDKAWRDLDGVLAWTTTYEPAEENTFKFGYSITYPEDFTIGGL